MGRTEIRRLAGWLLWGADHQLEVNRPVEIDVDRRLEVDDAGRGDASNDTSRS